MAAELDRRSICNKIGCGKPATHAVVLELRVHPHHQPALSDPMLYVCADHMDVKWDDVVSNQNWVQIGLSFILSGHQKPKRKFSNVKVLPLEVKQ